MADVPSFVSLQNRMKSTSFDIHVSGTVMALQVPNTVRNALRTELLGEKFRKAYQSDRAIEHGVGERVLLRKLGRSVVNWRPSMRWLDRGPVYLLEALARQGPRVDCPEKAIELLDSLRNLKHLAQSSVVGWKGN
jgi:hypothetical protein